MRKFSTPGSSVAFYNYPGRLNLKVPDLRYLEKYVQKALREAKLRS
jgi:hypothetical protein